ncbi:MAG: GNVR domain-containing protein [Ignavibacteria bacterium]
MKETVVNKSFTYYDFINIFLKNKKPILIFSLIVGTFIGLIVFFVMDPIFLSTATIKTTSKQSGLSGLLGADMVPDLGDISSFGGGSVVKELALYENILFSRKCVEAAIIRFNVMEESDIKYMFDAVKYFKENVMLINKDKVAGTMEVGAYDKDPVKAKEISEFLVFQLNKINTELNIQNAKNNKDFIQSRYNEAKIDLVNVEDSLREYQDNYGIAPDMQVLAAVKAEIEFESEIKSEEIKLEILEKILSPDQSEITIQKRKIEELQKQLFEIQQGGKENGLLTLKGKPEMVLNYLRLKREVEIQNKILTTIIPLLEQSKIEEKRETPSVLILDPPNVPDRKVKPKRLTLTLISLFISACLAFFYFIIKEKWNQNKNLINFKQ